MSRSPTSAPKRDDLPWLRRRARRPAPTEVFAATPEQAVRRPDHAAVRTPTQTLPHPRLHAGTPTILDAFEPTVTLTRVQSGVGALTVTAACGEGVGDLRLGCAYQLRSGRSSIVQLASGLSVGPAGPGGPVISASRHRYEELTVDLVQSRQLRRLLVYAFSESDSAVTWGGTLVAETFGKARVEVPLAAEASAGVLVILSVYNIAGEFVLRAEQEVIHGSVRDATVAYGFNDISWLDSRTALG